MVKTFGEMDSDIVDVLKQGQMQSQVLKQGKMQSDVLKQRQMQSDKLTRQFNSPTKPSLAGATKASLLKGQNKKKLIEDAKKSSPRVKRNKTGPNQLSYKESNVSAKHVLSEDIGGTTELKRLLTPINLFEDECIFCHSFRRSQLHGSMVCYLKGRVVSIEEGNSSNAIYVHKKCLEWTPLVWFEGDVVVNLESEIRRASRLRCRRCGLLGAALGCYDNDCDRSFHVPCAVQIDCRWDVDERLVLCPKHVSKTLPCDKLYTHTKEDDNSSSLHQSQCSYKEDSFTAFEEEGQQSDQLKTTRSFLPVGPCTDKEGKLDNHHRENQQTDQLNTSNAASFPQSPYIHKEVIFDNHQRENQQTDQFNILNPSYLSQSQCFLKEGISTNSSRDGNQIDQLDTSNFSSLPLGKHSDEEEICMNCERDDQRAHKPNTSILCCLPKSCHPDEEGISSVYKGEKIKAYQPDTSSFPSDQLVLLGLSLSVSEKEFACWTNARLTKEWGENVTHVIVGKGAGTSWSRSFEALMAILLGKWVVHFEWVADCSSEMTRRPEASYVLSMDSIRTIDGPKKGRIRATKGTPKLFSGLRLCLSAYMDPDGRHRVRNLIATAGGQVLRGGFLDLLLGDSGGSSVGPYFVFDGDATGGFSRSTLRKEEVEARKHAALRARVISHLRVLDAVAAYDAEILDR
ncbi:hypothetical protein PAHAL_3G236200 [Panicum hallii]|uniref:PHD-type domain-containing protein n=1 Tax=Panicum hallii TaxID=206008 RepID=A0A2T8KJ43_9POAL|nr:BRCA1-associated RING domain protein 1-like isoform X2 [Panicum hallii]PVH62205.1 hypothetical protein PAHAL_3G236200 [Panicum hallii]